MAEVERLGALAERINEKHRACEEAVGTALEHAIGAGELLTEAKASVLHGSWGSWLAGNFAGSDRTARAYMRVYARRDELEAKRQSSASFSLDGALKALSTPKDEPRRDKPATLEEMEARAEESLSQARSAALGIAESLDAIYRGCGWASLGYASFADYVAAEFGATDRILPIPYEVITGDAGEPLPVFAMADSIHAWGVARAIEPLLREEE